MSKSKCTKHTTFGALLEVATSKKCSPMWCEAHFEVKMYCTKHTKFRPLLEVVMSKNCTPMWREAHFEVKSVKKTNVVEHFWTFRCRFACQGHMQRIWQHAFRLAGAVQETCSSEMLRGPFLTKCIILAPGTQNDIWTSKSAPQRQFFNTFDFEMCFAPHRRALFRHLNFQERSELGVFCTFCTFCLLWLLNFLR